VPTQPGGEEAYQPAAISATRLLTCGGFQGSTFRAARC
jgi:hypothetical protein